MAKILIAEDAHFMQRLLISTLRKDGHETIAVENGEDAVQAAQQAEADLFILDIVMPQLDGMSTLRKLKSDAATADTPAIMLTSRGHRVTADQAKASGADTFLTKPFSPSGLRKEVQRLIQAS